MASFTESLELGKKYELLAEAYFKKRNLDYTDVRDNREYQAIDVDYIANNYKYEVKFNYHIPQKGHPGVFFWVELEIGNKPGWWNFNQTDYFFFFGESGAILIKNTNEFKERVNYNIEHGNHGSMGKARFDYKQDARYNGYVTAKSMRCYIEDYEEFIVDRLVTRRLLNPTR